jgi:uncharacterized cupin superfamily protein
MANTSDYTKVSILDLPDLAAGMGGDGSIKARGIQSATGSTRVGAMYHTMAPNTRQPFGHAHNESEEIFFVLEGSGTAMVGDDEVSLSRLDALRVSPEAIRAFESGPEGMTLLAVGNHVEKDGRMVPGWWGGPES